MEVSCANCGATFDKVPSQIKKTGNNFCSRSCAAKYNNRVYPKRIKTAPMKVCKKCPNQAMGKSRRCDKHQVKRSIDKTLAELIVGRKTEYKFQIVRDLARKKYANSDLPKECRVCKYSLHYEICHIRAIKDFPLETMVSEINDINNLVALCCNCHWEFDNGMLNI